MDKLKQMHFALFLAIVTSLCFMFPAIIVKLVMDEISTTGALAIRFFIAAISFPIVLYFYAGRKSVQKIVYSEKAVNRSRAQKREASEAPWGIE